MSAYDVKRDESKNTVTVSSDTAKVVYTVQDWESLESWDAKDRDAAVARALKAHSE